MSFGRPMEGKPGRTPIHKEVCPTYRILRLRLKRIGRIGSSLPATSGFTCWTTEQMDTVCK